MSGPSALQLSRLSSRPGLPSGRADLFRHIARMVELRPPEEFLVVPCGRGEETRFLAQTTETSGSGVDPDADLVEAAVERARADGLAARLHFDRGSFSDLPYKDDVFDVVIGEVGLASSDDPAAAVAELLRVTRPMGTVVLVPLVWTRKVEPRRQEVLVRRLGMRPQLIQQWKQMLRGAGAVDLYVEDLSESGSSRGAPGPLTGLGDLAVPRDRLGVAWRAWKRWGWQGLSAALSRDTEIRRLVSRERVLGVALIKGTKWPEGGNPS